MDADAYIGRCRHGLLADRCIKCEDAAEQAKKQQALKEKMHIKASKLNKAVKLDNKSI